VNRSDVFPFIPFDAFDRYLRDIREHISITREKGENAHLGCLVDGNDKRQEDYLGQHIEGRTIFFFNAASAFASAFASFFAVSFSSFVCASRLNVPTLAWRASTAFDCQNNGFSIVPSEK
jgi:hypothetical protein